jgi:hypothetical protein
MDLHKKYSTISVRNEEGTEEKFVRAQAEIKGYVASLGSEDAVVLEASGGALYWAEKIQSLPLPHHPRLLAEDGQAGRGQSVPCVVAGLTQRGDEAARGLAARTGGA